VIDAGGNRNVRARVRWIGAGELANALESYDARVTVRAQDFPTEPLKGLELVIDGARYAAQRVFAVRPGGILVGYVLEVRG
jgi:hypothetical protein